jgi:hypothetical protein
MGGGGLPSTTEIKTWLDAGLTVTKLHARWAAAVWWSRIDRRILPTYWRTETRVRTTSHDPGPMPNTRVTLVLVDSPAGPEPCPSGDSVRPIARNRAPR